MTDVAKQSENKTPKKTQMTDVAKQSGKKTT